METLKPELLLPQKKKNGGLNISNDTRSRDPMRWMNST